MTGELIPTGVTFGVGRNSINNSFSGTAYMNNISLDSGGNFSGGTGGGIILSGGTNLYNIFAKTSDIVRVQPGSNITTGGTATAPTVNVVASPSLNGLTLSGTGQFAGVIATSLSATTLSGGTILSGGTNLYNIFAKTSDIVRVQPGTNITTGGTATAPTVNVVASPSFNSINASGSSSFNVISASTIYSGSTNLNIIIASMSGSSGNLWSTSTGPNSIIANNGTGNDASGTYSEILGGSGNTANSIFSLIINGSSNTIDGGDYNFIIGGVGNLVKSNRKNATINSDNTFNQLAITAPGREHYLNTIISSVDSALIDSTGSTMISCSGITIQGAQWATIMQRAYVEEYLDLNPQSNLPLPQTGRMFFSGSPLFKLMINTGGTSADWTIV